MDKFIGQFMQGVMARNPDEREFHQAVREVVESVMPVVESMPAYTGTAKYWNAWLSRSGCSSSACRGLMTAVKCRSTAASGLK